MAILSWCQHTGVECHHTTPGTGTLDVGLARQLVVRMTCETTLFIR